MKFKIYNHQFTDGSGTVLFNVDSGETLVLSLPVKALIEQLNDPESEIYQYQGIDDILTLLQQENFNRLSSKMNGI